MRYIENENGDVVDGYRASSIRQIAYRIFHQLDAYGVAPKSWGVAGLQVTKQFYNEMDTQIPEMRLCAGHWKAEYLATHIYPSWYSSHVKRNANTKLEPEDDDCGSDSIINQGKRVRQASENSFKPQKRVKAKSTDEDLPMVMY
jgi:hypothetical protein